MKIKRRRRLEIKVRRKRKGNNGGGRILNMDRLISPCRGCGREAEDKRKEECSVCAMPYDYAMAMEEIYYHLPPGIDCADIHRSTDGRVRNLTELKMVY